MFEIFVDWLGISSLNISNDLLFIFCAAASLFVLSFIFDFFRFLMYFISGRH